MPCPGVSEKRNRVEDSCAGKTTLIDVILRNSHLTPIEHVTPGSLLWNESKGFRADDDFIARNLVFLDSLAHDLFRGTAGIDIGSIPGIETPVISCFENWKCLVILTNVVHTVRINEAHLFLFDKPWRPMLGSEAHGSKDGHRNS